MKEYIEKEKAVGIAYGYCHTTDGRCCGPDDVVDLYEELKTIPAADVVEVVRCRDCKWYGHVGCAIQIVDDSDRPKDDDFYSFGERKGGDE